MTAADKIAAFDRIVAQRDNEDLKYIVLQETRPFVTETREEVTGEELRVVHSLLWCPHTNHKMFRGKEAHRQDRYICACGETYSFTRDLIGNIVKDLQCAAAAATPA